MATPAASSTVAEVKGDPPSTATAAASPSVAVPHLFTPITIRSMTLRNRICVSPMYVLCYLPFHDSANLSCRCD
jgi:hypothetical protein